MSLRPSYDFLGLAPTAPAPEPHVEIDPETGAVYLGEGAEAEVKYVPFSPFEEYQVRGGETEMLHEEFHAVLCNDWRGAGTVTANGIKIKDARLVGPQNAKLGAKYWSADSALCARVADGPLKVFYTFNPARPDIVHLWDHAWKYLESLPLCDRVPFLDFPALAAAGREKARLIGRFTDAMQSLHADESLREINDARHNAAEMARVVVEMEIPAEASPQARRKRSVDAAQADPFTRAGRDGAALAGDLLSTRDLRAQAETDLGEIAAIRREVAPAETLAYDPLDDL